MEEHYVRVRCDNCTNTLTVPKDREPYYRMLVPLPAESGCWVNLCPECFKLLPDGLRRRLEQLFSITETGPQPVELASGPSDVGPSSEEPSN